MVCKPDSVPKKVVTINLELLLPAISSVPPNHCAEPHLPIKLASYLGLAPKGVYTTIFVTKEVVSSYPTFSPLPTKAVYFLLHFPWGRPRRKLSGFGALLSPDFPP